MEIILGWFIFSIVAGVIASSKGRSGFGYFILSLLLSPIIGILIAIGVPTINTQPQAGTPHPDTHVKCPDCKEFILKEANVCKHCGCKLVPQN